MQEKIGDGSFGTVYKARHKFSGDIRSVKIIERKGEKFQDEGLILKEIEILKQLVFYKGKNL